MHLKINEVVAITVTACALTIICVLRQREETKRAAIKAGLVDSATQGSRHTLYGLPTPQAER